MAMNVAKGRPRKKAFALAYTLLVSAVIMLFAAALFTRVTETLRLSGTDVNSVHAAALADTGAELAYSLLRDYDPQYFKTQNPLKSVNLGPDFAPSVIGGTFEVTVDDSDYTSTGLYPDNGTFYTVVSTGKVGNHVARSEMTLKMTNPLLNYLFLAPRNLYLGDGLTVAGPIVVNADPASGEPGDLVLSHASEYYNNIIHNYQMDQGDLKLDIQARASGDIKIQNWCDHGYTQGPVMLNGRYSPQTLENQDFNILCPWGSWNSHVEFTDEVALEAHAKFTTKIPTFDKLLKSYRAGAGPAALDISTQAGGVLVEFTEGQVFVSEAKTRLMGRVYDKAIAEDEAPDPLIDDYYVPYFGITAAAAQAKVDAELAWDDPAFPNDNYPADLGPGTGDYVEIYRIERGALLQSYTLSDANWTTLYLTTSRTDYLTADGKQQGPPVFVRGMVNGKVMVVYDVTSDSLDTNADKLHMMILGAHEMPADSPAYKLPTGGAPGVNGGVVYADRNIKADPDQTTFTNDRCMLMCRGTITGAGDSGMHRGRVHDAAGNPFDYQGQLNSLDKTYSQFYTGTNNDPDFVCTQTWNGYWGDGPKCPFYGIAVAAHSENGRWRIRSDGQVVDDESADYPGNIVHWDDLGVTAPPNGDPDSEPAFFEWAMRRVRVPQGYYGGVKGSFHSIQTSYDVAGDAHYDYSWQALKESEIRAEMFLPIQPIISSFQRL